MTRTPFHRGGKHRHDLAAMVMAAIVACGVADVQGGVRQFAGEAARATPEQASRRGPGGLGDKWRDLRVFASARAAGGRVLARFAGYVPPERMKTSLGRASLHPFGRTWAVSATAARFRRSFVKLS
jgi:hypothetical protein